MKSPSEIARLIVSTWKLLPPVSSEHWEGFIEAIAEAITTERQRQERLVEALEPFTKDGHHSRILDDPKAVGYDHCICRCDGFGTPYPCRYVIAQQVLKEVK